MKMKAPSCSMVLEPLDTYNYADWNIQVKTYLRAQSLWDIVEPTREPLQQGEDEVDFQPCDKKDSMALHVIQMLCGKEAFSKIREASSAIDAWNILKTEFGPSTVTSGSYLEYKDLNAGLITGDLNRTKAFLDDQPDALSAKIPPLGQTALEIAVAFGHMHIVNELAKRALEQNSENQANGYEKTMTEAVLVALRCGKLEMARTLFSALIGRPLRNLTTENGGNSYINQCTNAIYTKDFGTAFDLINRYPSLVDARDSEGNTPLMALASIPDAFPSGNRMVFWKGWIYNYCISVDPRIDRQTRYWDEKVRAPFCYLSSDILRCLGIKHLCDMKVMHHQLSVLFFRLFLNIDDSGGLVLRVSYDNNIATIRAIKNGILEFVDMPLRLINDHSFSRIADEKSRNVLFLAALHRQHEIFNRISRDASLKEDLACQKDDDGNTLLHMAGMPPDFTKLNRISGAALQMQRELQWFKEVQKIVLAEVKEATNKDGLTAHEFFTKNHMSMLKEGEQWTKDTASACSVVGTLIVGIMFAAAITVPGGIRENTGLPFFSKDKLFILFMVSDVLSLFSSSTSLLMLLGISTSRYAEEDFQESLPTKMMIALSTLLFSIVTMMIAFAATLLIVLHSQLWIVILIICLACVPIFAFRKILFSFLVEVTLSTYGQSIFSKKTISTYGQSMFSTRGIRE